LLGDNLLIAEVCSARLVFIGESNMVLRSDNVSKDSGAEAALVSNNKEVEHVTHVVSWLFGDDLVMHKTRGGLGNVITLNIIDNNIARILPSWAIVLGFYVGVNLTEIMNPNSPKPAEINFDKSGTHLKIKKKTKGVGNYFINKRKITFLQGKNIMLKLRNPGGSLRLVCPNLQEQTKQ
jgi:hypothetical protein